MAEHELNPLTPPPPEDVGPPSKPDAFEIEAPETQPSPKFIVLTVRVDNPSDQTGMLEMQGNFDTDYGIQVLTQEAYQQLGPGGISLTTNGQANPVFTFQTGKSTAWVEVNPEIQFALKLVENGEDGGLLMEKI